MIKKIVIKNLNSTLKYLALGKIKFYDSEGVLIESGSLVNDSSLEGETENFKCSVSGSYIGSYPINMIDTNTDSNFWLSDTTKNVSIEIQFKKYIDSISKISIIPLPGSLTTNGVTENFDIDIYDYDDSIIQTYNVTPTSIRESEQTIITNELVNYYIVSDVETINTTDSIRLKNVTKIKSVEVDQLEPSNTSIRYLFSIDNRSTWFSIKNGNVETVEIDNLMTDGMTKSEMENIIDHVFDSAVNLDIMVGLCTTNISRSPILRKILIYYI